MMTVNTLRLHIWLIVLVHLELNLKMHLCIILTETSQGFFALPLKSTVFIVTCSCAVAEKVAT